jgi:hypothetical protein
MKLPKLKKDSVRLWVTPDEYYDKLDIESRLQFKLRTCIDWLEQNRVYRVDFNVGTHDQITEYYNGYNKITKKEYDEHWKPYLTRKALIKAIKELK